MATRRQRRTDGRRGVDLGAAQAGGVDRHAVRGIHRPGIVHRPGEGRGSSAVRLAAGHNHIQGNAREPGRQLRGDWRAEPGRHVVPRHGRVRATACCVVVVVPRGDVVEVGAGGLLRQQVQRRGSGRRTRPCCRSPSRRPRAPRPTRAPRRSYRRALLPAQIVDGVVDDVPGTGIGISGHVRHLAAVTARNCAGQPTASAHRAERLLVRRHGERLRDASASGTLRVMELVVPHRLGRGRAQGRDRRATDRRHVGLAGRIRDAEVQVLDDVAPVRLVESPDVVPANRRSPAAPSSPCRSGARPWR